MRGAYVTADRAKMEAEPVHPHMRGAYDEDMQIILDYLRFIPTCVGHTLRKSANLRGFYHLQTIEVYNPSSGITMHFHAKALLILSGIKQNGSACFTAFSNGIPQYISD